MKLLLKLPTRSRPQQAMKTLQAYCSMATNPRDIGIAMSCDSDDDSMTRQLVQDELNRILRQVGWSRIFYGNSRTKIEACNANMSEIDYPWDIVMLISDDMIPIVRGYDDAIRSHMLASFPDTNGVLWFSDGHQHEKLNTLSIMGRTLFNSFGYIYEPAYKSFFCDTEFTDLCRGRLKDKCLYIPTCLIRHEHPANGYRTSDALYIKNSLPWIEDMNTYIDRKSYAYDWTILIPTIPGREQSLRSLIASIHSFHASVCPALRIKIALSFDNREKTIGLKRQQLLQAAEGKYVSFIDDDDRVTQAYFEDAAATIAGNYDCMRLRGQISSWTFTHSLANKLTAPMANETTFLRPPNHLNVVKADIAKTVSFRTDATQGEDLDWTLKLMRLGFLRSEYQSDESRIHYIYELGNRPINGPALLAMQRKMNYDQMLEHVLKTTPVASPQAVPQQLRLGPKGFVRT
jgi:hypothetical protein